MNSAVTYPSNGPLTQGTIFSCAVAEDYSGCQTCGLVITARCDVANDKVRAYNYVPIVTLDDWLHRDGRILLAERLQAETIGLLKSALRESGFSISILETETPRSVLNTLFPPTATEAKIARVRKRFEDLANRYELAEAAIGSQPSEAICIRVAQTVPKLKDSMLSELVSHRLAGYYFLSQIEPEGRDDGYVALLREVQVIPRPVAHAVANGLDAPRLASMCTGDPALLGRLRIATDDLAMPIGLVSSPNLEHMMQSFSLLFGRIGIADLDRSYLDNLWTRQPSVRGSF